MLKKVVNITMLFAVIIAIMTPMCDSVETAVEVTIPLIIGIFVVRIYGKDILVAKSLATKIKIILNAVSSLTALLLLAAVCIVEIEALDYVYLELDETMMAMIIFGVIGVILELVGSGVIKLIRHFTSKSCK